MKQKMTILSITVIAVLLLTACGVLPSTLTGIYPFRESKSQAVIEPTPALQSNPPLDLAAGEVSLEEYQNTLQTVYAQVNPSVVNIQVEIAANFQMERNPFGDFDDFPAIPKNQIALGSGFVWDTQGHIVTNNHVVDGADNVIVTFADGQVYSAKVVGKDPDSDLAVIKVDAPSASLTPLVLADSDQVKVGQVAIAIGNPYGLEGTMTVGIVSALGRSLPSTAVAGSTSSYIIPDVIQTDAAINPGNSGGVLVDITGKVIGVTAAIESTTGANAGIGFVIPANIVARVVPALIKDGSYAHPWLGISGITLTPKLNEVMGLDENQRGVLVEDVIAKSPADKAGLVGSDKSVEIDGRKINVGGDIIVGINGEKVEVFEDLAAYLIKKGVIGETIRLDILRDNKPMSLEVTLAPRPKADQQK